MDNDSDTAADPTPRTNGRRQHQYSDALGRLAGSLQRLDMTMSGLERLSPKVMYAIAAILDTVPDEVAVHQVKPPRDNGRREY
jgi:hypothetical protein